MNKLSLTIGAAVLGFSCSACAHQYSPETIDAMQHATTPQQVQAVQSRMQQQAQTQADLDDALEPNSYGSPLPNRRATGIATAGSFTRSSALASSLRRCSRSRTASPPSNFSVSKVSLGWGEAARAGATVPHGPQV